MVLSSIGVASIGTGNKMRLIDVGEYWFSAKSASVASSMTPPGAMVASAAPGSIRDSRPGALVASTAPGNIREFSSLSRPGAMVASAAPGSIRDSRPGALVASTAPGNIRECSSLSRPGALGTLDFLPFVVVLFEEAPR